MKFNHIRIQFLQWIFKRWIPVRVMICVMAFTCTWTSYVCRLQMPILALPMINSGSGNSSSKGACSPDDDSSRSRSARSSDFWSPSNDETFIIDSILADRLSHNHQLERRKRSTRQRTRLELFNGSPFDWSPRARGQLIAAYSYGNIPGNLIGGLMAMRYGPRRAILWTSVLAASISLFSPLLAQIHWIVLAISRIIVGLTGGVTFPACHTLIAKWAPPDEKARFVWSLLGGTFGTIFTYPLVSYVADNFVWELGWYIPALLMFVWCVVWFLFAFDSPEEHPGISEEEKQYILTSQAGTVKKERPTFRQTPLKEMFSSIPFIALICCHAGNLWLIFFYQNAIMIYLTKALGFKLTKGGLAAGLPWAARMFSGFLFSWTADSIKKKKLMSTTLLRKSASIFSHLICGLFIIAVSYVGCDFVLANVFLVFALGFNGAASVSNLSNNQDLSPNYAGFLYGIMNTIGSVTGAIIPMLVEEIAGKHGNPIDKWQILFWITGGVSIVSMMIFMIGGSGNIQSWNEIKSNEDAETGNKEETVSRLEKS